MFDSEEVDEEKYYDKLLNREDIFRCPSSQHERLRTQRKNRRSSNTSSNKGKKRDVSEVVVSEAQSGVF